MLRSIKNLLLGSSVCAKVNRGKFCKAPARHPKKARLLRVCRSGCRKSVNCILKLKVKKPNL